MEQRAGYAYSFTNNSNYSRPEYIFDGDILPEYNNDTIIIKYRMQFIFSYIYIPD
jgi:hypothetical protein